MDFQKITGGLVVIGGTISGIGSAIGYAIGGALGTSRDSCGWQYVQPTHTSEQLNAMIQGTAGYQPLGPCYPRDHQSCVICINCS
jgi:hypothetical protein